MKILSSLKKEEMIILIEEYFKFYKRTYDIENQFIEYVEAVNKAYQFLDERDMKFKGFSEFQKDLIILGFMNDLSLSKLEQYIKENLTDSEMEKRYLSF